MTRMVAVKTWLAMAEAGELGSGRVLTDQVLVAAEGDSADTACFLACGAAEIFHISEAGFSVVVKLVTAPTVLASPEVLVGEPVYRASIRATGPRSRVHTLSRDRFLSVLAHPEAGLEATIDIALAFTGAARMEASRLFGTDALLATLLLAYAEVFGADVEDGRLIELRRSQLELADAIGASERSVNRIITRWKADGLVAKRQGHYILSDVEALRATAGDLAGCLVHRWREVR